MFKWYKNYVKKVWSTILGSKPLSILVVVSNLAVVVVYIIYSHQILKTFKETAEIIEAENYKKHLEEEAKRRAYSNN